MALQLLIEDFDGAQTFVPLEGDEVTIGRTEGNTIQLTEQNVSRKHARLVADDGEWYVEDLASYNGIRVNGVPTSGRVKLGEGDTLQIGDYNLVLTGASARATLNLDGRAPANQGAITVNDAGGAASSGSLPRLAAAAPARAPASDTEDERRSGGAGAAIGGVVVALAACGAVAAWALGLFGTPAPAGTGGPAADKAVVAANDTPPAAAGGAGAPTALAAGSEAATGDGTPSNTAAAGAGAAGTPGGGETPPDTAPTVAPPPEDTAADTAAEPTEDTAPAQVEPVQKATSKSGGSTTASGKTAKSSSTGGSTATAEPAGDPAALLADARKASVSGDNKTAYKLAKESYAIDKNAAALQQMGVSACKMGDEKKARAVYDKLAGDKKSAIEKLCASSGVVLAGE